MKNIFLLTIHKRSDNYREEQVFKDYNSPHKPVRVFTYLIGREISDLKAANWMACQNKGKDKDGVWKIFNNVYIIRYAANSVQI